MDNLAHTLAGAALARAGLDRWSPRATATLIVASNCPDLDSVARFYGPLYYLEHHRGITHSLVGILLQSLLLAALVSWSPRRSLKESTRRNRPVALALLSATALGLHLFMDYTNSYGIRPLLPWDATWRYGDLVFIIDPWIWLLLGAALFAGSHDRRDEPWGSAVWILLALATSSLVAFVSWGTPIAAAPELAPVWFAGLAGAALLRRWARPRATLTSRIALVALAAYWVSLAVSHRWSLYEARRDATLLETATPVREIAAIPLPAAPFRWLRVTRTDQRLFFRDETTQTQTRLARNLSDPRFELVRETCTGRALLRFFRFPAAEILPSEDGVDVILRDTRFTRTGVSGFGVYRFDARSGPTPVDADRCPTSAAWFAD